MFAIDLPVTGHMGMMYVAEFQMAVREAPQSMTSFLVAFEMMPSPKE
jgi:hypothetical protein